MVAPSAPADLPLEFAQMYILVSSLRTAMIRDMPGKRSAHGIAVCAFFTQSLSGPKMQLELYCRTRQQLDLSLIHI